VTTATDVAMPLGRDVVVEGEAAPGPRAAAGEAGEAAAPGAAGTLVVGYGSLLRGDDGVGPRAAALLMDDPRLRGATVLLRHQLTPDLSADVSEARLVVLIDARADDDPGVIRVRRLDEAAAADPVSSHHVEPADLVGLAFELWGSAPPVYAVTVGAHCMDFAQDLSPAVEQALPRVIDAVAALVADHADA